LVYFNIFSFYDEIFVQTSTTAKYGGILKSLVKNGLSVHLAGPQGNGKSLIANQLYKGLGRAKRPFMRQNVTFTSQTNIACLYDIFMNRENFSKFKANLLAPPMD